MKVDKSIKEKKIGNMFVKDDAFKRIFEDQIISANKGRDIRNSYVKPSIDLKGQSWRKRLAESDFEST